MQEMISQALLDQLNDNIQLNNQVNEIITHSLAQGNWNDLREMVEMFVFNGTKSIDTLSEMMRLTQQRHSEIFDEMHRIFVEIQEQSQLLGMPMHNVKDMFEALWMPMELCLSTASQKGLDETNATTLCSQVLGKSQKRVKTMLEQLTLLEDIQPFLQDWLWALTHQSIHLRQPQFNRPPQSGPMIH